MGTNSVRIIIADLQSKYNSTTSEKNEQRFFLKIAAYGKYMLDHNTELENILASLENEAKEMIREYTDQCELFIRAWKPYAQDLVAQANKLDIVEHLDHEPTCYFSSTLKFLEIEKPEGYFQDVDNYYFAYNKMIFIFEDFAKKQYIKNHFGKEGNLLLWGEYQDVTAAWDRYKNIRGISNWWAHYQIMRATHGILQLDDKGQYFSGDKGIDGLYEYEFAEIQRGNKSDMNLLRRSDFQEYLDRLHSFIIPRLKEESEKSDQIVSSIKFENNALFIRLNDQTETSIDFASVRGNNDMLILFKILYEHWQKQKEEIIKSKELNIRLQSAGVDKEKLQGVFISTTLSNIRKKIRGRRLDDVISIAYDKDQKGYSLKILTSN